MHNHEPTPPNAPNPEALRHSDEEAHLGPPEPTSRHERRILERLLVERGDAFQVYLDRVWRGTAITDMEDEFENLYWASYERVEHFITDIADAQGWDSALEEFTRTWAIPAHSLTWNYSVLLEDLRGNYEFIAHGGQIHVFIK